MNIKDVVSLTCDTCEYMINFEKESGQKEFDIRCPYRDVIEKVACMKHTELKDI
jgi:hypothetical protein